MTTVNDSRLPPGHALKRIPTTEDDPHPNWWRQAEALKARVGGDGMDDWLAARLLEEQTDLLDRIAGRPARTLAGVVVQLRTALDFVEDDCSTRGEECQRQALENAIAALERIGRDLERAAVSPERRRPESAAPLVAAPGRGAPRV